MRVARNSCIHSSAVLASSLQALTIALEQLSCALGGESAPESGEPYRPMSAPVETHPLCRLKMQTVGLMPADDGKGGGRLVPGAAA